MSGSPLSCLVMSLVLVLYVFCRPSYLYLWSHLDIYNSPEGVLNYRLRVHS
jgi:hypothetical protein